MILIPKKMNELGYKTCPDWLKEAARRAVNYKCQQCNYHEDDVGTLILHRIKRGNKGGLYTVYRLSDKGNNLKIVCTRCHKRLHSNEFKKSHSY